MPFTQLVLFNMNLIKHSLQKELTDFVKFFPEAACQSITKSAFCQSRQKLKADCFVELNDALIKAFYKSNNIETWKGFRLLAIDGSAIDLPKSPELYNKFPWKCNRTEEIIPKARISSFFDVQNNIIINTQIGPREYSELTLAKRNLDGADKGDLIIYDRGFAAVWLMYYQIYKKLDFLIRIPTDFIKETDKFFEEDCSSKIIEINRCPHTSKKALKGLNIKFNPFKIRLVKVILENGEIEVLATTLLDEEKYPTKCFKDLYFKRWGVEVEFDHLKNHMEIENFTGKSELCIRQDFYANIFIENLRAVIQKEVQDEINKEKKDNKYEYKVNRNLSLGYMKDRIITILSKKSTQKAIEELKGLFKIEPVPIRRNRKYKRKKKNQKRKFNMNYKGAI